MRETVRSGESGMNGTGAIERLMIVERAGETELRNVKSALRHHHRSVQLPQYHTLQRKIPTVKLESADMRTGRGRGERGKIHLLKVAVMSGPATTLTEIVRERLIAERI